MSDLIKKRLIHPLTTGMGKNKIEHAVGSVIEMTEAHAELFKSRLADPGEQEAQSKAGRKSALEIENKELKQRVSELETEVGKLTAEAAK